MLSLPGLKALNFVQSVEDAGICFELADLAKFHPTRIESIAGGPDIPVLSQIEVSDIEMFVLWFTLSCGYIVDINRENTG